MNFNKCNVAATVEEAKWNKLRYGLQPPIIEEWWPGRRHKRNFMKTTLQKRLTTDRQTHSHTKTQAWQSCTDITAGWTYVSHSLFITNVQLSNTHLSQHKCETDGVKIQKDDNLDEESRAKTT